MKTARILALGLCALTVASLTGEAFAWPFNGSVTQIRWSQQNRYHNNQPYGSNFYRPNFFGYNRNPLRQAEQAHLRLQRYNRIAWSDGQLGRHEYQKLRQLQNRQRLASGNLWQNWRNRY